MKMSKLLRSMIAVSVVAVFAASLTACSGSSSGPAAATVNGVAIPESEITENIESIRAQSGLDTEEAWGQFLVSNTGKTIPEEKREDVFKAFLEIHDLTQGDGLGLPICYQMAQRMNGDLHIDPQFTRGTRFVLDLQV